MKYSIDLESLPIYEYKALLKQQNLLPGRRILWQGIEENFAFFERQGIKSIAELKKRISSPKKIATFASKSGISEEYLVILKREIGSIEQKPVSLSDFPGIDGSLLDQLSELGLITSKDYWNQKQSFTDELFCLCDLVRINGVGPLAARAFYEAGYQSALDVSEADPQEMLEKVSEVNEIHRYYKARLGIKDMQFCIDFARLLKKYAT
ncbi:MAG: hypothetical protein GX819_05310 [Clostridiaceae bacterium]|nr:hypothetical protein [Clostridiaceae bacterium]